MGLTAFAFFVIDDDLYRSFVKFHHIPLIFIEYFRLIIENKID